MIVLVGYCTGASGVSGQKICQPGSWIYCYKGGHHEEDGFIEDHDGGLRVSDQHRLRIGTELPGWRGDGRGISPEKNLPLNWSEQDSVKWKMPK